MRSYIVRAALRDEANEGWIWADGFPSRTVVKITNHEERGWALRRPPSVVCEVRQFDRNFIGHYNSGPRYLIPENERQPTLVLSQWYRDALGGFGTTAEDDVKGRVRLVVKPMRMPGWRSLRAACQHPDIVVRLGTRLGVLGTWLGVVGVWFSTPWVPKMDSAWTLWLVPVGAAATIAAIYACRGPRRLPLSE
jgi:hypothetical protein